MTKKDYKLIAQAITNSRGALSYASTNMPETNRSIEIICYNLAYELQKENRLFDMDKFYLACGIESEKK